MDNITKAALAGFFFGVWPLLMNRSGLNGNLSSFAFASIVALCVAVVAFRNIGDLSQVRWSFVVSAGIIASFGLLSFNGMLANVDPKGVSALFVVMIVVQAVIPALYGVGMNILHGEKISAIRVSGFVLAIIASILLTMKESDS